MNILTEEDATDGEGQKAGHSCKDNPIKYSSGSSKVSLRRNLAEEKNMVGSHITLTNILVQVCNNENFKNERKSEQAHKPHASTLLENTVYNNW